MCKSCKMDPNEVAKYRQRQGAVEIDDFDEQPRYHKPGTGKKYNYSNKKKRTPRGCPENDNKAHIWVWTSEYEPTDIFYKHFGFHKKETRVCAGCLKTGKTRETEEYMRRKEKAWYRLTGGEFSVERGEPVSRYGRWCGRKFWSFQWEMEDPDYKAKYDAWWQRQRELWKMGRGGMWPRSY